ncbi:unnamed protein product [Rhizophagus irregularis]|nr:unnamed protein product [Rhizophagus irregularis]
MKKIQLKEDIMRQIDYLRVKDSSREICKERKKNSPKPITVNNSWSSPDEKLHINTETKELPTRSSFRVLEGLSCFDSSISAFRPPRSRRCSWNIFISRSFQDQGVLINFQFLN